MPLGYLFRPMKAWLGLACVLAACSGPPPRAPNPTRPLDERRACKRIEFDTPAVRDEIRLVGRRSVLQEVRIDGCSPGLVLHILGIQIVRLHILEAQAQVDGYEGLRSLEVVIAAYRSARDGVRVGLPLVF